jgi:hypothetical protein
VRGVRLPLVKASVLLPSLLSHPASRWRQPDIWGDLRMGHPVMLVLLCTALDCMALYCTVLYCTVSIVIHCFTVLESPACDVSCGTVLCCLALQALTVPASMWRVSVHAS